MTGLVVSRPFPAVSDCLRCDIDADVLTVHLRSRRHGASGLLLRCRWCPPGLRPDGHVRTGLTRYRAFDGVMTIFSRDPLQIRSPILADGARSEAGPPDEGTSGET